MKTISQPQVKIITALLIAYNIIAIYSLWQTSRTTTIKEGFQTAKTIYENFENRLHNMRTIIFTAENFSDNNQNTNNANLISTGYQLKRFQGNKDLTNIHIGSLENWRVKLQEMASQLNNSGQNTTFDAPTYNDNTSQCELAMLMRRQTVNALHQYEYLFIIDSESDCDKFYSSSNAGIEDDFKIIKTNIHDSKIDKINNKENTGLKLDEVYENNLAPGRNRIKQLFSDIYIKGKFKGTNLKFIGVIENSDTTDAFTKNLVDSLWLITFPQLILLFLLYFHTRQRHSTKLILSETEIALLNTEKKNRSFDTLFEAVDQACYIFDLESNTGMVNNAWKSMFGYETLLSQPTIELWMQSLSNSEREKFERLLISCRNNYASSFHVVINLPTKSEPDSVRSIEIKGRIFIKSNLSPTLFAGTCVDITEELHFKSECQQKIARYNLLFNKIPTGVLLLDKAYQVVAANECASSMLGIGNRSLLNKEFSTIIARLKNGLSAEQRESTVGIAILNKLDKLQELIDCEIHLLFPRDSHISIKVININDNQLHSALLFTDITIERKLEDRKVSFITTAAHELRTPMASIYGYSEFLLERLDKSSEEFELLSIVYNQAQRMSQVLDDFMDLNKLELNDDKYLNFKKIDAKQFLLSTLNGFAIPPDRIAPVVKSDNAEIVVDEIYAGQAVINILSNAYKYSKTGTEVFITGESSIDKDGTLYFCLKVTDFGIGMTNEQLERIFERFYRADNSGEIPGTGLGMSIVNEIMKKIGGDITIESQYGVGSSVTLWFPMEIDAVWNNTIPLAIE